MRRPVRGQPRSERAVSTETFLRTEHLHALACISIHARKSFRVKAAVPPEERGFSSHKRPDAEAGATKSTALRCTRSKSTRSWPNLALWPTRPEPGVRVGAAGPENQRPGRRAGDDAALRASSSNYSGLGVHIANGGIKRKVRLASRITLGVSAIGKVCASSRRSGLAAGRTGCAGWLGRSVYWRAAKPSRKTVVMSSASWLVG